jgi:DNA polymerase III subunit beta
MHFVIAQDALVRELGLVSRATEIRRTMPSLSRVRLEARSDGILQLTAVNLEFALTSQIAARVIESGVIWLAAERLCGLASALEGEITFTTGERYATIRAGRSRSRMPWSADAGWELEPMPENAARVAAPVLGRLISCVRFAAAKESTRFGIAGVLIRFSGGQMTGVALDQTRGALIRVPATVASPSEFLFPLPAIADVPKLLEGQEQASVAISRNHFFVAAGGRLLVARKLEGSFPDYGRLFPEPATAPATIDRIALDSAVARVLLFAESAPLSVPRIRSRLRPGELAVSVVNERVEEAEDPLDCDYAGPETAVDLNGRHIREFLNVAPGGKVRVFIEEDGRTELRIANDDAYRYVMMPIPPPTSGSGLKDLAENTDSECQSSPKRTAYANLEEILSDAACPTGRGKLDDPGDRRGNGHDAGNCVATPEKPSVAQNPAAGG